MEILKEYKPALFFLAKFLGFYFTLNILYGLWFESFSPLADPVTYSITGQTIWVLDFFYDGLDYEYYPYEPLVWIALNGNVVLNAFEGCNGINVMILFIAFLVAYSGPLKDTLIYSFAGLLVIHISNILRIALLFVVADKYPDYMYYAHKYVFTGIIYTVIFVIWFIWVKRINRINKGKEEKPELVS